MADWWMPPQVLLLAAPVAMVAAAYALSAGERRARAQQRRDQLGPARRRVEEATAGERVVLTGRLDVIESACARFEDGAEAAVATVVSEGLRAIADPVKTRTLLEIKADSAPRLAHSVRASVLVLSVGSEHVVLTGPCRTLVGSDETDPEAPFASLSPAVRERIALATEHGSLPDLDASGEIPGHGQVGPGTWTPAGLVHASPLFRSLRSGSRVRVAGLLSKHSEGERTGYRERARWALTGTLEAPLDLACEDGTRFRGPVQAALRGVRSIDVRRIALVTTIVLAALGAFAILASRHSERPPHKKPAPASVLPIFQHQERCEGLRADFEKASAALAQCKADDDCTATVRAGAFFDLEGCYRYANKHLSTEAVDTLEKTWNQEACSLSYELCPPQPLAMCREGRCVERPPAPVPETWHREEVPGGFYLYLPAEAKQAPTDSGEVRHYRGAGMDVHASVGQYDLQLDDSIAGEVVKVGGHKARLSRTARSVRLFFEEANPCGPPRCSHYAEGEKLMLQASCDEDGACNDAWIALSSVRFW